MSYFDEYFCPNCGAILNNQSGFDPDLGVWKCTECGEELYGDELEDTMRRFDGVIWHCDSCGAVLNIQSGFYDDCMTWCCTECGHVNLINEDEIYDSEEDYQNSKQVYTCPDCGATLNKQWNFEENSEYWTCEECQTDLYKDVDGYKVLYRCPHCDEVLNKQTFFNEYEEYYTCNSCYTDLYKSSDKYEILYRCPHCDEILNTQACFDANEKEYTCEECDTALFKEDNEYRILYKCPHCGAILNEQWSFSENDYVTCQECYTNLYKDGVEYFESSDENNDTVQDFDECDSYYTEGETSGEYDNNYEYQDDAVDSAEYSYHSNATAFKDSSYNHTNSEKTKYSPQLSFFDIIAAKLRTIPIKNKITILLFVILAVSIGAGYYEFSKLIPIQYATSTLIGKRYESVVESLEKAGFENISINEISDLDVHNYSTEYQVTDIKIGWITTFEKDNRIPSNFPVTVTYHTLKKVSVPLSSKKINGLYYEDVVKAFEDAGFFDVSVDVQYDIITGWLTDPGEVESVTIGDIKKFSSNDLFRPDEKVKITYHDYRKNKPK